MSHTLWHPSGGRRPWVWRGERKQRWKLHQPRCHLPDSYTWPSVSCIERMDSSVRIFPPPRENFWCTSILQNTSPSYTKYSQNTRKDAVLKWLPDFALASKAWGNLPTIFLRLCYLGWSSGYQGHFESLPEASQQIGVMKALKNCAKKWTSLLVAFFQWPHSLSSVRLQELTPCQVLSLHQSCLSGPQIAHRMWYLGRWAGRMGPKGRHGNTTKLR